MSSPDVARTAELERRVGALEDAREIEQLHHRYVRCLADRDLQGCADCYAHDAACDLRGHGVERGGRPGAGDRESSSGGYTQSVGGQSWHGS